MTEPALILQHRDCGPSGLLADRLRRPAIQFEIHRTWLRRSWPGVAGRSFVASLGSPQSLLDAASKPDGATELATAPDQIPAGPWLQWHFHRISTPPGAPLLATSGSGPLRSAPDAISPSSSSPSRRSRSCAAGAASDRERLLALGLGDGEALLDPGYAHAAGAARGAFQLFDAFWDRARR